MNITKTIQTLSTKGKKRALLVPDFDFNDNDNLDAKKTHLDRASTQQSDIEMTSDEASPEYKKKEHQKKSISFFFGAPFFPQP